MAKKPKRPRDTNQLAKTVVDLATMDEAELKEFQRKWAAATKKTHIPGRRGSSKE
jgi:hypothetical protein